MPTGPFKYRCLCWFNVSVRKFLDRISASTLKKKQFYMPVVNLMQIIHWIIHDKIVLLQMINVIVILSPYWNASSEAGVIQNQSFKIKRLKNCKNVTFN